MQDSGIAPTKTLGDTTFLLKAIMIYAAEKY